MLRLSDTPSSATGIGQIGDPFQPLGSDDVFLYFLTFRPFRESSDADRRIGSHYDGESASEP